MNIATLSTPSFQTALPLRQRIAILALAVIGHAMLLAQPWLAAPGFKNPATHELSVSIVKNPAMKAAAPSSRVAEHRHAESKQAETATTTPQEAQSEPVQPAPAGLPDREPDYRAAYLNNPQPGYPLTARRMGWQGKVVLEVEVLADGTPGEVAVQQSSGREVLDDAALRAVRGWRFVPARIGGLSVTKRFLLPIAFNLT